MAVKVDIKNLDAVRLMPLGLSKPHSSEAPASNPNGNGRPKFLKPLAVEFPAIIRWEKSTSDRLSISGFESGRAATAQPPVQAAPVQTPKEEKPSLRSRLFGGAPAEAKRSPAPSTFQTPQNNPTPPARTEPPKPAASPAVPARQPSPPAAPVKPAPVPLKSAPAPAVAPTQPVTPPPGGTKPTTA